jgi:hypothetical protein
MSSTATREMNAASRHGCRNRLVQVGHERPSGRGRPARVAEDAHQLNSVSDRWPGAVSVIYDVLPALDGRAAPALEPAG